MPHNPFESIPPLAEVQAENPNIKQGENIELIDLEKAADLEEFLKLLKIGLAENKVDIDQAASRAAEWLQILWGDESQTDYYDDETGQYIYPEYLYSFEQKERFLEDTESFHPEMVESFIKSFSKRRGPFASDEIYNFLQHIDELRNYDRSKLVYGLITAGFAGQIMECPDIYEGLDSNDLAKHLIQAGQGALILKYTKYFTPNRPIVLELIENDQIDGLAKIIPSLQDIPKEEHEKLAIEMINRNGAGEILESLRTLHLPDKNKIADAILKAGHISRILDYLDSFPNFPAEKVVEAILCDTGTYALREILQPKGEILRQRLNIKFNNDFAQRIIHAGKVRSLLEAIGAFTDLEEDTALELVAKYGLNAQALQTNIYSFHDLTPRVGLILVYDRTDGDTDMLNATMPELFPDKNTPSWIKRCFEIHEDKKIPQKIRLSKENALAVELGVPTSRVALPEALLARITHRLTPEEYLALEILAPNALDKPRENESALCHELATNPSLIKADEIRRAFKLGRETFGDHIMLEYMNRADLSRHDALYFMPNIVALYKKSGLNPETFGNNILLQVAKDQAIYDEGSAHHELAAVCQALERIDLEDIKAKFEQFSNIQAMQDLAQGLDVNGPFVSWKALKKYRDIVQLLAKTKILDQLNDPNMRPRMRTFLEKLAFHPNIAMDEVIQFWQAPARFLNIDDYHTNQAVNDVKKPSNYISLPHLGLTAEDLRDAYVEGSIDEIQTLPPMEKVFENIINDETTDPATTQGLLTSLIKGLGQERKGIKGQAARPKKLFDNIKKFCKERSVNIQSILSPGTIDALKPQAREELENITFEPGTGIKRPKGETYRIRIGKKSDPDMTIAGNDTASCMPFGSGKNNVYMFNPNCVQLVVERKTADETWRTAAQSVVTIDHKATKTTPELIQGYMQQHQALRDLFNPQDFANLPVVTCDNIEIAKNEEGQRYRNIKTVYEKFFQSYLKNNAEKLGVDRTRVAIGQGYTPNELGFRSEKNHFVPQAPMGYSDNVHEKCFILETGLSDYKREKKPEVRNLNVRDAISAAYIEGKAYADNESLMEYLHKVQNNIIGTQIANEFFNRPNLSFIVKDENGLPLGYMIAYEGKTNDRPMVYISDLAADPENKMVGPVLVRKFIRSYFENYGVDQKAFIPIFTNAREQTSYQWILKLAQTEAKKHGAFVEMVETGTFKQGADTMHNVLLLVAKSKEELVSLREKYKQESL